MLRAMVEAMRRSTRRTLADARLVRRRQARAIRDRLHGHRAAMFGRIQAVLAPRTPPDAGLEALHARVLDVLDAHPEGISAREIGNELGIDWRSVTAVTSSLVARGAVDHIEQDFYPSGKASRTC
jgi:DNA-binding NarL/FixJ family response regulator